MPWVNLVVAIAAGYLIGAIPSGVLVGRLLGADPRSSGSGRTGTTNALRTLGARGAAAVAVMDVAKGVVAVLIGFALGGPSLGGWAGALAAPAAVIGHIRSIFIGFSGGRGVATGAGAMLILAPLAVLAAIPEFGLILWRTRLVSLGSILASITVALVAAVLYAVGWVGVEVVVAAALIGAVVIVAHADNIARLRSGTERRLGHD